MTCNKRRIAQFMSGRIEVDDKLFFLFHLDECPHCWSEVYNAVKAQHSHYYKPSTRGAKLSAKELNRIDFEDRVVEVA